MHTLAGQTGKTSGLENGFLNEQDILTVYMKQINHYPLLTMEEEQALGAKICSVQAKIKGLKDKHEVKLINKLEFDDLLELFEEELKVYKDRLIVSNLRLVVSIAKKYKNCGLSLSDLINEGNIGLMKAVDRYDPQKGYRFSTYGTWWIRQAIVRSLSDKGRTIRVPIHMMNLIKKCFNVARTMAQDIGREPTLEELATYLDLPVKKVVRIMGLAEETSSLDSQVTDENITKLLDLISDKKSEEPFEHALHATVQDALCSAMDNLREREQEVIKLRYGLFGETPHTLSEIGKLFSITRERVRQIQNRAIQKLRNTNYIEGLKGLY